MSDIEPRTFPIMVTVYGTKASSIPWSLIAPHEAQALINHDQTLERLAERGGLDPCEALSVILNLKWRQDRFSLGTAVAVLAALAVETARADREADRAKRADVDGWCDACAGLGIQPQGSCMCGGTGKAADAVCHLRDRLHDSEAERDALRAALADLNGELSASGGETT